MNPSNVKSARGFIRVRQKSVFSLAGQFWRGVSSPEIRVCDDISVSSQTSFTWEHQLHARCVMSGLSIALARNQSSILRYTALGKSRIRFCFFKSLNNLFRSGIWGHPRWQFMAHGGQPSHGPRFANAPGSSLSVAAVLGLVERGDAPASAIDGKN